MNPTARQLSTYETAPFPFNAVQRFTLPDDPTERVRVTVAAMCAMIHHAAAVGPNVAALARHIGNPKTLWLDLKDLQERTPDPDGAELLRSPEQSAETARDRGVFEGDCDDVAMLACAIAIRKGWACALRVMRREGMEWEHVYAIVKPDAVAYVIDPQETEAPFLERAGAAETMDFPVWRT